MRPVQAVVSGVLNAMKLGLMQAQVDDYRAAMGYDTVIEIVSKTVGR
jgi:hypothetical protein